MKWNKRGKIITIGLVMAITGIASVIGAMLNQEGDIL